LYEANVGALLSIRGNIRPHSNLRYLKNKPIVEPVPAFLLRYGPFFANQDDVGSLLFASGDFALPGTASLEGEPYRTDILDERKKGVFLGGIIKYRSLIMRYFNDFIDNEKGQEFKISLEPEYAITPSWRIVPQVSAQYWNHKYVDYYFGVHENQNVY